MEHSITISCDKQNLSKVRIFIEKTLSVYDLPSLETHKLVLAVDEVCANLIIHANNCNPNEFLELNVEVKPNE